jgi:light-regulated signal transduction histidine kinase (bacteriophytochrome)
MIANDAAIRFAGIPRELFLSQTAATLEPNIRESLYFQKMIQTMETGEPSRVQYQVASSGNWIEITLSRMDRDHLIIVYSHITESKVAQLKQDSLLEELRRSNENLEEFASVASHDLKEPIRKVYYFTQRLRDMLASRLSGDEQKMLDRVETAASRMQRLIDDLLEYAHVNRGQQYREDVDLNHKVEMIQTDLELMIIEKKATLTVATLPTIHGYRRQLQQLFHNLVSNSLKYARNEHPSNINITATIILGIESNLKIRLEDEQRRFHLIEVSDNGIGFEQEYADKIFNIFTRLHGNSEYTGTGVGVAIVKKVAENHGGYIGAIGYPNRGATFRVLLPC